MSRAIAGCGLMFTGALVAALALVVALISVLISLMAGAGVGPVAGAGGLLLLAAAVAGWAIVMLGAWVHGRGAPVRRMCGLAMMGSGGAASLLFGGLGVFLLCNYVEWPNWPDALRTVGLLAGGPALAGAGVLAAGRVLHGDLAGASPLLRAAPWVLRIGGGALAVTMVVLLGVVLVRGYGPEDLPGMARHLAGIAAGLGMILLAEWLRAKRRTVAPGADADAGPPGFTPAEGRPA